MLENKAKQDMTSLELVISRLQSYSNLEFLFIMKEFTSYNCEKFNCLFEKFKKYFYNEDKLEQCKIELLNAFEEMFRVHQNQQEIINIVYNLKLYIFVDTENVDNKWLELIETKSKIFIFYTDNKFSIDYDDVETLIKNSKKLKFIKCCKGNNSLDFQLVSFLGKTLPTKPKSLERYCIMSDDKGFDVVCHFWEEKGYKVQRFGKDFIIEFETVCDENKIEFIIDSIPEKYSDLKDRIIELYENGELCNLHNYLVKRMGNNIGLKLYNIIKNL